MSWEAYRWTAKSPSELYHVLGPHGVDELIRQALAACWRDLPEEGRSIEKAITSAREVASYNLSVWRKIKQPTPEGFFAELRPSNADGHFRQAMVLTWMMMPRSGGRVVGDALKIVNQIFERNIAGWMEDHATFTGGNAVKTKKKPTVKKSPKQTATKAKSGSKAKSKPVAAAKKKKSK